MAATKTFSKPRPLKVSPPQSCPFASSSWILSRNNGIEDEKKHRPAGLGQDSNPAKQYRVQLNWCIGWSGAFVSSRHSVPHGFGMTDAHKKLLFASADSFTLRG